MFKQKKFSQGLSFEIALLLQEGKITKHYFDKKKFDLSCLDISRENIVDSDFEAIPEDLCNRMIEAKNEFEQGKILYEALKNISIRDASDIDFWNYLSHNDLYPYIHHRWPDIENPPKSSSPESYILNHWLLLSSAQNSLIDFTLSGLWWTFHISEDTKRSDPYELTKILFLNQNFRTKGFGQAKFARHKEAVTGVLEFIMENNLHDKNFEENGSAVTPYINLLGGTQLLSYFDKDWFKERLKERFEKDIKEHGRLFRRDVKPTGLFVEPEKEISVKIEETSGTSSPKATPGIETKTETTKTVSKSGNSGLDHVEADRFLNFLKQGGYNMTLQPANNAIMSLPIQKVQQEGFLYQFFSDGRVSRTSINSLLQYSLDFVFVKDSFLPDTFLGYEISNTEMNVGMSFLLPTKERAVRIFPADRIKTYSNPLRVSKIITDYIDDIRFKLIPIDHDTLFEKFIYKNNASFIAQSNPYYQDQLALLKNIWPDVFDD